MNKNYMVFPMTYMRITQSYLGTTSHLKHTTGDDKDYPIDIAGRDSGEDSVFCPCDEMEVVASRGYQDERTTNTIWLVSTSKVTTPTFYDICFMTLTHLNDSEMAGIPVGKKFRRGEVICREGKDGTSANHIHLVAGRGRSDNWTYSSSGSLVMTGDNKKPEEIFYIDPSRTTVLNTAGLKFQTLPSEDEIEDVTKEEEDIEILEPFDEARLIFVSGKSKYYKIFLKENAKLYLKDS